MNTVKIFQGSDRWGIYVPGGTIIISKDCNVSTGKCGAQIIIGW